MNWRHEPSVKAQAKIGPVQQASNCDSSPGRWCFDFGSASPLARRAGDRGGHTVAFMIRGVPRAGIGGSFKAVRRQSGG